ncbi:MAG: aldo/keto reductase [Patescibacteria group bacterium]|nr:aldo/keto reductase [Patescibacteria group bacterium]
MANQIPTRKLGRTDLDVSRIALGTVELGYTYGIGPRQLPSNNEALALLQRAVELGINFFDTAHFYGCAEARIAASGIAKRPEVIIATKCGHDIEKNADISQTELEKAIRHEVSESRKTLGSETLSIAMVHGGSAEQIKNGMIIEIMQKLKDEGQIQFVGISTRGEDAPSAAIKSGFFDCLQVGYSILDQRQSKANLRLAVQHKVGIIARSVFLKGALTPSYVHLPNALSLLKERHQDVQAIADSLGITVPTLALRFALSNRSVDTVLVGTQSIGHLEKSIDALEQGPLAAEITAKLEALAIDDANYVDPSYWPADTHSDDKSKIVRHFKAK